eukprot:79675_1
MNDTLSPLSPRENSNNTTDGNYNEIMKTPSKDKETLSLPMHNIPTFEEAFASLPSPYNTANSPLASLERCISNPLVRGVSNVSASSETGGAHFVPFGRGHEDLAATNIVDMAHVNQFTFSPNLTSMDLDISSFMPGNGVGVITPLNKIQNIQNLIPLQDIDTDDATTSQNTSSQIGISSNELPSDNPPQTNDHEVVQGQPSSDDMNTNNLRADASSFVPFIPAPVQPLTNNPNAINVPPSRNVNIVNNQLTQPHMGPPQFMMNAGLPLTVLPQSLSAVPGVGGGNINMAPPPPPSRFMPPLVPYNILHQQRQQQQQRVFANLTPQPPLPQPHINGFIPHPQQNNNNNMVQGSQQRSRQQTYSEAINNYMKATNNRSPSPHRDGTRPSPNGSPPVPQQQQQRVKVQENNNNNKRFNNLRQQQRHKNDISNMEVTDVIKMNLSLTELLSTSMICKFMKHQNGSRYIQEKLKNASPNLIEDILKHIIFGEGEILSLSEDIF